jgi:uncharacterized protein YtpQ (UPF0354 family)
MSNEPTKKEHDDFAAFVITHYKARGWTHSITYNQADFSLDLGNNGGWVYLGNIYKDWLAAESEADKAKNIEILVNSSLYSEEQAKNKKTFEQIFPDILPAIRGRDYVENMWMAVNDRSMIAEMAAISRPFAESLSVMLVVNTPDAIGSITSDQLKDWGKTFDDVFPLAMDNLKRFKGIEFEAVQHGIYLLSSGDFFDPSALLIPSAFGKLDIKGDVMVVAVSRSLIEVTGSTDRGNHDLFARIVEGEYSEDVRPVSLMPLVLKNGKWYPADSAQGKYPAIDRLKTLHALNTYQNQKATLEEYFKKTGRDVFVATFDVIEDNDKLTSFSTLAANISTLLPQTDVVILAPTDMTVPLVRSWQDVMTVCKPVTEPNTYPQRYVFPKGIEKDWADRLDREFEHPQGFPELKPSEKA